MMPNCETTQELIVLRKQLAEIYDMIGWLCTSHQYVVNYKNKPDDTKRVQKQLDEASEFINVIYIYSILDEAEFKPGNKWISPEHNEEYKAWVHVRHTGAHKPGGRASVYYADFDEFMNSNQQGLSGLKQNCVWDATSIKLKGISYRFYSFAIEVVNLAIGNSANY